ncbi:hypothetical protein CDL12_26977 [Handroanthus impetiginosus]|uniref:Uncharacterized protein n=1 Tax=Handroanthus impetiginosus TaxID=429701 RepID=A0A2G9G5E5_9LAMI|nr:hypothetical protein CDL12_26977 [Handroanthus impetiginosus]
MGSIGFDTEESQPSTTECKKYKLQEKLLNDCGAVNFALVPRKQRSGCGSDANDGINTAGYSREAFKQFHFSYEQSQKHSAVFLSLSQNGCSSTFHSRSSSAAAAPQVHVPPYTYSSAGFAGPHLQDWQNGGRDAQALFPHLHSVLGSKYQRSSPQQQQLMPVNSSFLLPRVERHNRHLNPAYERNSTTLQSDNILQLQLLCHKNL